MTESYSKFQHAGVVLVITNSLGDRLSGLEDLFDFSSLTFLHICWEQISIWVSSGSDILPKSDLSAPIVAFPDGAGNLAAIFLPMAAKNKFIRPSFRKVDYQNSMDSLKSTPVRDTAVFVSIYWLSGRNAEMKLPPTTQVHVRM